MKNLKPSEEKVWLKYYSDSDRAAPPPKCTLYDYLSQSCRNHKTLTAIHYYGTDVSYGSLLEKIDHYADIFASLGIHEGENVAFLTVALPETFYAIYALNKIGAVPVVIEPRMSEERINFFINLSKARYVFSIDIAYPKISDIVCRSDTVEKIIIQSATDSLPFYKKPLYKIKSKSPKLPFSKKMIRISEFEKTPVTSAAKKAEYKEGSVCAITQTGGSTGLPKGVMQTNDGLNCVTFSISCSGMNNVDGDSFLNIMPIFTSYGLVCGMHMPLILGLKNILIPDFKPDKFPDLIIKYKPTYTIAVPTFFEKMLYSKKLAKADLGFIKHCASGGDIMSLPLEDKLFDFYKSHNVSCPISQGFGMSETSAACTFSLLKYKRGSIGIPILGTTIGIFEPNTTNELDYNNEGEICITGMNIMSGYYENEEENKKAMILHPDGKVWIHSGDIGYIDEDGFLYFKGRIKRVIPRFDGHKVYPIQLENVVASHAAVRDCSVIGIKDREHSQGLLPLIIVQLSDNFTDKAGIKREILELCTQKVEERGQPCGVVFVDKMPKTLMSKNDVRKLTEMYGDYDYLSER